MKIVNYQKKKTLIHDGFEDEFLKNHTEISCPCCNGKVYFGLYNSEDLDTYDEKKRKNIVRNIKGMKFTDGEIQEVRYKNIPLRVSEKKCSNGLHDILVVFTYKEIQPTRYESYLVGVFDDESLNQ
ncbi:hypothetical protein N1689_03930 [Pantoea sp. XY16]|uniref:hypothetical protein n=1 Tax=Pantoea sp. XY16 TaxID=2976705 RepID=UPI0021A5D249|nr:hypothetical protein [Pantoea sp. XY16]MCT2416991.1 hypothetical protein [Pantoea sp. XY16]